MKIKLQNFHIEFIENKGCLWQRLKQYNKNLFSVFGSLIKSTIFAPPYKNKTIPGEMAEWSIAAVLKTAVLQGTGGLNPSLSAMKTNPYKSTDL